MAEMREVLDIAAMGARLEIRESTDERFEFDAVGRPFGLIAASHVHARQSEHYEVIEGAMRLVTPHADIHLATARPTRSILDFADDNRAAQPPVKVQKALARALVRAA